MKLRYLDFGWVFAAVLFLAGSVGAFANRHSENASTWSRHMWLVMLVMAASSLAKATLPAFARAARDKRPGL